MYRPGGGTDNPFNLDRDLPLCHVPVHVVGTDCRVARAPAATHRHAPFALRRFQPPAWYIGPSLNHFTRYKSLEANLHCDTGWIYEAHPSELGLMTPAQDRACP